METCIAMRTPVSDCFDNVPEFQLSRQVQELRRLSLAKKSKDKKQFPMDCEQCGIKHSSLVGRMDPDDGKWYCNGCWIEWNKSDSEDEDFDDSIFDEDGISSEPSELPEHFKKIQEELFGSDETKTIPKITCLLAIIYPEDKEKRELGELVYEKIKTYDESLMLCLITNQFLKLENSEIRELLSHESDFIEKITEYSDREFIEKITEFK
jgi:hypothetical protein